MKITVFPQTLRLCPPETLRQKVSPAYGLHPLGADVQVKGLPSTARNLWQEQIRRQNQEYKASDRTGDNTITSKLSLLVSPSFSSTLVLRIGLSIVSSKETFSASPSHSACLQSISNLMIIAAAEALLCIGTAVPSSGLRELMKPRCVYSDCIFRA